MDANELFHVAKRESTIDMVVNNIKKLLIERKIKPGDRLPNELELSEAMGVSRGSVREAMKILSAFGIVDVKAGSGTYICEAPNDLLTDSFLFSFFISNPDVENLYEFRHMFEINILEIILKHYEQNTEERYALHENLNALKKMMNEGCSCEQLQENDIEFHKLLGKCTKNILMERVYDFIIGFMEPSIAITHRKQRGEFVYEVHKNILEVIDNQDYDRINEVITASVNTWSVLQEA